MYNALFKNVGLGNILYIFCLLIEKVHQKYRFFLVRNCLYLEFISQLEELIGRLELLSCFAEKETLTLKTQNHWKNLFNLATEWDIRKCREIESKPSIIMVKENIEVKKKQNIIYLEIK